MCTVVIEVPGAASAEGAATRLLAVRDEDPEREWDPPGEWWPEAHPGVQGVRDRRAGGAWLAVSERQGRLAVILNRPEPVAQGRGPLASRGGIVLDSVASDSPYAVDDPPTASFNLVEVRPEGAFVTAWDGSAVRRRRLAPGVHMIAHHEVDDPRTARITAWLPEFRALAGLPAPEWRRRWAEVLERSAELSPADDRAIVRDNRAHGFPTVSLFACLAEVARGAASLEPLGLRDPRIR
ncbi:NRDE family protein [Leucobacter sp. CSA1]|uniref:NRDE family protein n=1 Tax=Leucobacter chromiisoli TaxID=2796471 RepID=A0A934UUV8_9MICO|nr:NRDE family protein [Leucobacter chromiisoli]MBK0419929.1 NRDE family protein [Leucobacter chromiisoli]